MQASHGARPASQSPCPGSRSPEPRPPALPSPGTCFEQHDLVVLAELHEAREPLGELHHVLDGLGEAAGTALPHLAGGLRGDGASCSRFAVHPPGGRPGPGARADRLPAGRRFWTPAFPARVLRPTLSTRAHSGAIAVLGSHALSWPPSEASRENSKSLRHSFALRASASRRCGKDALNPLSPKGHRPPRSE